MRSRRSGASRELRPGSLGTPTLRGKQVRPFPSITFDLRPSPCVCHYSQITCIEGGGPLPSLHFIFFSRRRPRREAEEGPVLGPITAIIGNEGHSPTLSLSRWIHALAASHVPWSDRRSNYQCFRENKTDANWSSITRESTDVRDPVLRSSSNLTLLRDKAREKSARAVARYGICLSRKCRSLTRMTRQLHNELLRAAAIFVTIITPAIFDKTFSDTPLSRIGQSYLGPGDLRSGR